MVTITLIMILRMRRQSLYQYLNRKPRGACKFVFDESAKWGEKTAKLTDAYANYDAVKLFASGRAVRRMVQ